MFLPDKKKPALLEDQLYRLRLSLNTPVVETEDLPEGPARAALLVHFDPVIEGVTTTVGIRSLKDGTVVYYRYQAEISDNQPFEAALDTALAFSETMGFLFDDEEIHEIDAKDQARALKLFWEMMGEADSGGSGSIDRVGDGADPDAMTAEIDLGEEVLELDTEATRDDSVTFASRPSEQEAIPFLDEAEEEAESVLLPEDAEHVLAPHPEEAEPELVRESEEDDLAAALVFEEEDEKPALAFDEHDDKPALLLDEAEALPEVVVPHESFEDTDPETPLEAEIAEPGSSFGSADIEQLDPEDSELPAPLPISEPVTVFSESPPTFAVASETSDLTQEVVPEVPAVGAPAPVHGLTKFRAVAPIEGLPASAGDTAAAGLPEAADDTADAGLPEPSSPESDPPELDDIPAVGRRADDPQTGPRALGRLQLVKRRALLPTEPPQEPVNPIERLLGSF